MNTEAKVLWTRVDGAKSKREVMLIGKMLNPEWLKGSVLLTHVRLVGNMKSAFSDLMEAARVQNLNLPIVSLRMALISRLENVISLERSLGMKADAGGVMPPAIKMYSPPEEALNEVREQLAQTIRRWLIDDVETWAERNSLGTLAERLRDHVSPSGFQLDVIDTPYINDKNRPDYTLIVREIGSRLAGESLFEDMGPCEMVASPDSVSNSVELMTLPRRGEGRYRDDFYSMVARLSVVSMPYCDSLYLSISAMKRVWAKRIPSLRFRSTGTVTGYVMTIGRPISRVSVVRTSDGWVFGDEYATLLRESGNELPPTLSDAINLREFDETKGWWAGLPELPSLFSSVSPRTVFEGDELSLLETVSSLITPLLKSGSIPIREVKLPTLPAKPMQEMLKLSDFGVAGSVFSASTDDDEEGEEDVEGDSALRKANLDQYREQNMMALRQVHGDKKPVIWVLSDYQTEKGLIRKTIEVLFGDAVTVIDEPLPPGTHGLRSKLDMPDGKARQRFAKRLECWQGATKQIRELTGDNHAVVLICASDRDGTSPEDPVNYFAGIHAFSLIGANVHHALPIENVEDKASHQNFLHRVQSALLDVMLAHSGAVFGVKEFISRLPIPDANVPKGIYGVQAVRSRAQTRSGQTGVNFLLFSRVLVETGHTQVRIGYKDGGNKLTPWMPLSRGLAWMGSQRRLQEGDDVWLRAAFEPLTRESLAEISAEDPNAVVMIQWDSVRTLWRGISDADLNSGNPPKLGDLSLLRFGGMTFIRLRNSNDTLSLRTLVRSNFRGWLNGSPTGEVQQDNYATTDKRLVEVSSVDGLKAGGHGHFIASMGYAKTVQVKRGLSCYRAMPRMMRIGKGSQEFEFKSFEVASMDASLPAPMDLSVLCSPQGVQAGVYAILAMGLRLGYAHHNDWTRLPMPLFFRTKIEDYVIRYPEDNEETGLVLSGEREGADTSASPLAEKVVKAVEGDSIDQDETPEAAEDVFDFMRAVDGQDYSELVRQVRETDMPDLYGHSDFQSKQLYRRIFIGDANVGVELPFWVKPTGSTFTLTGEITKRKVRRSWDWMYEFGYVRPHGDHMPSPGRYLDWLARKLRIPHACPAIINAVRGIGGISFTEMETAIEEAYNPANPDAEVNPFSISDSDLGNMLRWACDQGHDRLLGWLVFMVSQVPHPSWVEVLQKELTGCPGSYTRQALHYYLATASVVDKVIASKGKSGRLNIQATLPNNDAPEPEVVTPEHMPRDEAPEQSINESPGVTASSNEEMHSSAIEQVTETTIQERDLLMTTKKTLVDLIESIQPGTECFNEVIGDIRAQISILEEIHADRVAVNAAATALAAKLEEFTAYQADVALKINAMHKELGMPGVKSLEVQENEIHLAQRELDEISSVVSDLENFLRMLREMESAPVPASLPERRKRRETAQLIEDNALVRAGELRHLLDRCICLGLMDPEDDVKLPDAPPSADDGTEAEDRSPIAEDRPVLTLSETPPPPSTMDLFTEDQTSKSFEELRPAVESEPDESLSEEPEQTSNEHPNSEMKEVVEEPQQFVKSLSIAPASPAEESPIQEYFEVQESAPDKALVDTVEENMDVLKQLFTQRLYGLADVHVAALGSLIEDSGNEELTVHQAILSALVRSMEAMDCEFSFDTKLAPELSNVLTAESLPSGNVSDPEFMALGILAAGISNMLFDKTEVQWRIGNAVLARFSGRKALYGLVEHLDIIRQRGLMLTRDLFLRSRIGDKVAIENEIARMRKRASNWKDSPELHRNFHNNAFKNAHGHMFGEASSIGKCLLLISKGEHIRLASAFEEAKPKFKRPAQTIEESFKKVDKRVRAEGTYQQMMIENINSAETFVTTYMQLVRQRDNQVQELTRDMQSFLDKLRIHLNDAIKEAGALNPSKEIEHLYRDAAVKAFKCVIQLFDAGEPETCIPGSKQRLLLQLPLGKDLLPALKRPDAMTSPLCAPQSVFMELKKLAGEHLVLEEPGSERDINRALADAYQGHISEKRFLPAFLIAAQLPTTMLQKGITLEQQYHLERDKLAAELQDARQRVAHAMTLNALPTSEATRMQWLIEELLTLTQRNSHSIGRAEVMSASYPDFPQAFASLRSNVLQPLSNRLRESQVKLEAKLDSIAETGMVPSADVERIREMVDSGNPATLLTAYDALNMLEHSGRLPARFGTAAPDLAAEYDQFIEQVKHSTGKNKHLLDELKIRLESAPSPHDPDWLAHLDEEQRKESKEFISAWINFFIKKDPLNMEMNEKFFYVLGITAVPAYLPESGRHNRARFSIDKDTFRYITTTPDDPLFIPPVLGSSASYNLCVALYGSPQENDIRQVLAEINNVPSIVFARTQYDMKKRGKVCFSHPALYVDDDLIAYAALQPGPRLSSILKVGMLTFSTNPYDDYQTKPVPSEMFFGRQKELERLRSVKGLAVLYGGRRLGKSSLLSQMELETQNKPGERAIYISMYTADCSGDYVTSGWEFIYDAMVNRNMISPMAGMLTREWKAIQQHIERQILESGKWQSIYLLIDEADDLMRRELHRKTDEDSFVKTLTQFSDDLSHACHVRMVIAGLHNMTRMADDVNSVFGKTDPIALKPFTGVDEVQRGLRLITKPLAAMGYLFRPGEEDLAMRIMAVCNYYPAFIQLYCKHLVEKLQNKRQDKKPPCYIEAEDLSKVEKDNNLLSELREKFALNLKLDKRYKAIALILADVYYSEVENGVYNGLNTSELREHCETFCPAHFENSSTGVYEALLDEMCKLNVIERAGTKYLLRNPNIAMMVGDRDRVTTLLSGLASEPPEMTRNQGERRVRMVLHQSREMLFPMPMSWIRNYLTNTSDGQLLILAGNAASGISDLARVSRDEEWKLEVGGQFIIAPVSQPSHLSQLIDRERRKSGQNKLNKFVAIHANRWKLTDLPDYASIALKAGKHGLRIILLAPPERALALATAIDNKSLGAGDANPAWQVVPIPPWSEDAIHYFRYIHENIQVADNSDALVAIRKATCGFTNSVLHLCTAHLTMDRALAAPETTGDRLADSKTGFYDAIGLPPAMQDGRLEKIEEFLGMLHSMELSRSNHAERQECMETYSITEPMWDFLYWMGMIQEGPGNTWTVPWLYAKFLEKAG